MLSFSVICTLLRWQKLILKTVLNNEVNAGFVKVSAGYYTCEICHCIIEMWANAIQNGMQVTKIITEIIHF